MKASLIERVYRTRQHFVCSAKTDTTTNNIRQARQSCRILHKGKQGRCRILDCNETGLCRVLHYCRFLYIYLFYLNSLYTEETVHVICYRWQPYLQRPVWEYFILPSIYCKVVYLCELTGDKSFRASAEQMGWQEAQNSFLWTEK